MLRTYVSLKADAEAFGWGRIALYVVAILSAVTSFLSLEPIAEAESLYALGNAANPFFIPEHAVLLYGIVPFATASVAVFFCRQACWWQRRSAVARR